MILVLFEDYCDTKFYHGFMNCYEDEMPVPSMGESYLVIVSYLFLFGKCEKSNKKFYFLGTFE